MHNALAENIQRAKMEWGKLSAAYSPAGPGANQLLEAGQCLRQAIVASEGIDRKDWEKAHVALRAFWDLLRLSDRWRCDAEDANGIKCGGELSPLMIGGKPVALEARAWLPNASAGACGRLYQPPRSGWRSRVRLNRLAAHSREYGSQ